jgi:hypothetical protein
LLALCSFNQNTSPALPFPPFPSARCTCNLVASCDSFTTSDVLESSPASPMSNFHIFPLNCSNSPLELGFVEVTSQAPSEDVTLAYNYKSTQVMHSEWPVLCDVLSCQEMVCERLPNTILTFRTTFELANTFRIRERIARPLDTLEYASHIHL